MLEKCTKTMFRRHLNEKHGKNYDAPLIKDESKKRPYGDYLYATDKARFDTEFLPYYKGITGVEFVPTN